MKVTKSFVIGSQLSISTITTSTCCAVANNQLISVSSSSKIKTLISRREKELSTEIIDSLRSKYKKNTSSLISKDELYDLYVNKNKTWEELINYFENNYKKLETIISSTNFDVCMLGGAYAQHTNTRIYASYQSHAYLVQSHYYDTKGDLLKVVKYDDLARSVIYNVTSTKAKQLELLEK